MSPRAQAPGGGAETGGGTGAKPGTKPGAKAPGRRAYHHGDLRNALVDAALEMVRTGGPEAIVLREAARATGVSSTAAYRHFESHRDLVEAVKERAGARMDAEVAARLTDEPARADRGEEAVRRMRAVGRGYVRFALEEPGLFRLIFRQYADAPMPEGDPVSEAPPLTERNSSYMSMSEALDELVEAGELAAGRRAFTDVAMWAAVHGISTLLLETDLSRLDKRAREAAVERVFDVVFHGILTNLDTSAA
ncbi:TetR/AcrR family transcriptional regulator [Yinghuangia soli]|uniref:TetR/AcrR family transcriptional regulator n=1 Tax=Yinghuangia soli TaxID=2908204 RepID=A0AA41Q1A1_9ACTN|nr:TetR/AcrR family transcriptional regulator [Yinghuangia soli]MCF2529357.1 TetR/AcrR family transcriptional regulator [Yinghuangia soli]